ncbi:hypothetical protein [Cellvibrio sp.]|uniref:hypothetical protein n=1 Tax=Cellvibrio sp. TaxID=1965322 RepID=UPI00396473B3
MKKLVHHKKYAYIALLIWFIASLTGMHGHYCFDGGEPPVSVHFDVVDGPDVDHNALGKVHIDVDNNPAQASAIKVFNLDLPFLALALFLVFVWPVIRGQHYNLSNTPSAWLTVTGLRPPLRAPPKNSH